MNDRHLLIIILICLLYFIFCHHIDYYLTQQDPLLKEIQEQLAPLHPKFKNLYLYEASKTYTINKSRVYICLKDEHGRYYNRNMLVYVVCHEYAHVLNDEWDTNEHGAKFWAIFDDLLRKAAAKGIYNPNIPILENYCGHD